MERSQSAATEAAHHTAIIYYGTELPLRSKARRLRHATVVLQRYHPLCEHGGFRDYFPYAQRFVYFNPTAAHERLLREAHRNAATLGHDKVWNLERLDLSQASARRFAIAQGQSALRIEGVHGLFVDDLDQWDYSAGRRHVRQVLDAVTADQPLPTKWFVNRGFGFWNRLPGMSAVLLEELSPYQLDRMGPSELTWVKAVVLRAVRYARAQGADVYSLTYDAAARGWRPHGSVAAAVAAIAGEPLFARRHLDSWPHNLSRGAE